MWYWNSVQWCFSLHFGASGLDFMGCVCTMHLSERQTELILLCCFSAEGEKLIILINWVLLPVRSRIITQLRQKANVFFIHTYESMPWQTWAFAAKFCFSSHQKLCRFPRKNGQTKLMQKNAAREIKSKAHERANKTNVMSLTREKRLTEKKKHNFTTFQFRYANTKNVWWNK